MMQFARERGFALPAFSYWTPAHWAQAGAEHDEIRLARLGWDVTDFGKGDFAREGLTLLTIRNGIPGSRGSKPYCEKLMLVGEGQVTPMHFHWSKTEDIINRGGGNLVCKLYAAGRQEQLSDEPVHVNSDGTLQEVPAGTELTIVPGASITLTPYLYHAFWGAPGHGPVLVGEVSSVNDDERDNRFLEPLPRFPAIEEDEPPLHLLCHEYRPAV